MTSPEDIARAFEKLCWNIAGPSDAACDARPSLCGGVSHAHEPVSQAAQEAMRVEYYDFNQ